MIHTKKYWIALTSSVLLLLKAILKLFGYDIDVDLITTNLTEIITIVFTILTIIGVVTDPYKNK